MHHRGHNQEEVTCKLSASADQVTRSTGREPYEIVLPNGNNWL